MRKIFFPLIFLLFSWSCLDQDGDSSAEDDKNVYGFDFTTTETLKFDLNYRLNGYSTPIDFELYTEFPYTSAEGTQLKGIEPILRAFTTSEGRYSDNVLLPSHTEMLYLRTSYYGVPSLVPIPVNGSSISFDVADAQVVAQSRAPYTYPSDLNITGQWNLLGKMNTDNGVAPILAVVMNSINSVFRQGVDINDNHSNIPGKIPVMRITKDNGANRITLSFVHSDGLTNSTIGYYTYRTDSPPTSLDQVRKTIAIPNAAYVNDAGALRSGYCVDLKYWDGRSYVSSFPKGTSIGFFVIKDGFDTNTGNVRNNPKYGSHWNPATQKQQIIGYTPGGNGTIILGVETDDRNIDSPESDDDFNDIIFFAKCFPDDASDFGGIIDNPTPVPDPRPVYTNYIGTLIFEDLWPSRGDYDVNDVVVEYTSKVWRNSNNKVIKVEDSFTPVNNGAQLQSAFAFQYGVAPSAIKSMTATTNFTGTANAADGVAIPWPVDAMGFEQGQSKATVMVFDDIRKPGLADGSNKFEFVTEFVTPQDINTLGYPPYNPFVVIIHGTGSNPRNRELHLSNHLPTVKCSDQWFSTGSDRSLPPRSYYISSDNYPFAINIPIHNFVLPSESSKLNDLYPFYFEWASSFGDKKTDWYLYPAGR